MGMPALKVCSCCPCWQRCCLKRRRCTPFYCRPAFGKCRRLQARKLTKLLLSSLLLMISAQVPAGLLTCLVPPVSPDAVSSSHNSSVFWSDDKEECGKSKLVRLLPQKSWGSSWRHNRPALQPRSESTRVVNKQGRQALVTSDTPLMTLSASMISLMPFMPGLSSLLASCQEGICICKHC